MSAQESRGPTKTHLEQLITTTSRSQGVTAARLRRWVSAMVLLGRCNAKDWSARALS